MRNQRSYLKKLHVATIMRTSEKGHIWMKEAYIGFIDVEVKNKTVGVMTDLKEFDNNKADSIHITLR